ncbi:MAG: tyrosine-type recombinase/integrase [Pseudomonadota bacterium]
MARGKRPDPRYLRQRGNVWFFQKRLSPTLAEHLGKKVFQQTTNTGDLDEACRIRDRLLADLSDLEAELKGQASTAQRRQLFLSALEKLRAAHAELQQHPTDDGIPLDITDVLDPERLPPVERDALVTVGKANPPAQYRLSLRATLEDWTNSPLVERKPTTISKNTRSVELFLSSVKLEDIQLEAITRKQVKEFVTQQLSQGKTRQTVANYLAGLSAIWSHAVEVMEEELERDNPFKGHNLKPKATVKSYDQFTRVDVQAIFKATEDSTGLEYVLPRMGFYTGARISELCSLRVTDIQQHQRVWCLVIREGKNRNAAREVPIHPELLPLVKAQLERAKAAGSELLFPEVAASKRKDARSGAKFSQWFSRLLKKTVKRGERRLGFHSFRTTAITIMGDAGVSESVIVWITGHERGLTTANKVYNRGPTFKTRLEAVETIRVEALH